MSDVLKFTESCQSFNARLYAKQAELAALVAERDILIEQARGAGVMVSAAKGMLGKLHFTVTMPEGYRPPADAGQQGERAPEIVRHDSAAE